MSKVGFAAAFVMSLAVLPAHAADGTVNSINIEALKAVFTAAGVPFTADAGKWPILDAQINGFKIFTSVANCPGQDPNGACTGVIIESWPTAGNVSDRDLAVFNKDYTYGRGVNYEKDGQAAFRLMFDVSPGVSPDYVRLMFRGYGNELQAFFGAMSKVMKVAGADISGPGFSAAGTAAGDGPGQASQRGQTPNFGN